MNQGYAIHPLTLEYADSNYIFHFQLLIVGFDLTSPAYDKFKNGKIKLLDVITQLNEEDIDSKEAFQRSTRDKTMPLLTLERKRTTPPIKSLLIKGIYTCV